MADSNQKRSNALNENRTGNLKYSEFEQLLQTVFFQPTVDGNDTQRFFRYNQSNVLTLHGKKGFLSMPTALNEYSNVFLQGSLYQLNIKAPPVLIDKDGIDQFATSRGVIIDAEEKLAKNKRIIKELEAQINPSEEILAKANRQLLEALKKSYYSFSKDVQKALRKMEKNAAIDSDYVSDLYDVLRQNLYSFDIETTVNPDKSLGDITESGFYSLREKKVSETKDLSTEKSKYFKDLRNERSFNRGIFVGQNIGFETTYLAKTYFDSLKKLYENEKLFAKRDIVAKEVTAFLHSSLEDYTGKDKFFIPVVEEKYADTLEKHLYYMISINERLNSRIGKSKKTELRELVAQANKYGSKYAKKINEAHNIKEYRKVMEQIESLLGIKYSNINKEEAQNFLERFNAGKIQSEDLMRYFNPLEADLATGKAIKFARNRISKVSSSTHLYDEGKQGYYQTLQETDKIYQKVKRRLLGTSEKVGTIMKNNSVDLIHLSAVFYNDLIQKKILKNHETIRFGTNMEVMAFLFLGEEEKHTALSDARQQTLVARKILDFYRNGEKLSEIQIKNLQSREAFIIGHRKLKTIVEKYQRIREKPVNKQVYYKIPLSENAKPIAIKGSANILLELVKDILTKNELESLDKDLFKYYLDIGGKKRVETAHQESIAENMFKIIKARFSEMDEVLEKFHSISRNDAAITPIMTKEMQRTSEEIFSSNLFKEFERLSNNKPELTVEDFLKQKEELLRKYLQDAKDIYKKVEAADFGTDYSIFGINTKDAKMKGSKILINDFFSRMNVLRKETSQQILRQLSDTYDRLGSFQRLDTSINPNQIEELKRQAAILEKLSEFDNMFSDIILKERLSESTVLKDIEILGKPFEKSFKEPPMIKPGKALMIAAAGAAAFGMLSMMNPTDQTLKENKITKSTQFARSSVEANAVVKSGLNNPTVYFGDGLWQSENMNRHYMM